MMSRLALAMGAVALAACGAPARNPPVTIAPVDGGSDDASVDPGGYRSEAVAMLEQADAALDQGDFDRAAETYRNLMRTFPYSKLANVAAVRLADILVRRGRFDEAAQAYEKFLHEHPSSELWEEVKAKYEDARARAR